MTDSNYTPSLTLEPTEAAAPAAPELTPTLDPIQDPAAAAVADAK